jgi:hypothetical protein
MKPPIPLHARSGSAITSSRISALSTPPSEKRATWTSGIPFSYAALANAGSPSRQSLKRWEKRRSDLSALLIRPGGTAFSAPATPRRTRLLEGVEEETNHLNMSDSSEQEADVDSVVPPEERGQFASAALELQRQRRSRGIEAFFPPTTSPPPKYTQISPQPPLSAHITRLGSKSSQSSPTSPRSSFSASRFTAMQMPRHPLSLHSLTLALNGALAARRYAASHLLALRFGNGDSLDDSGSENYWEDVRSVMALLTSTLANATAPLIEALDASARERLQTENPTPTSSHSRSSSLESPIRTSPQDQRRRRQAHRSSSHLASFAPLPSHLARFAAHVDAMTNALNDAHGHLESCVASLRDGTSTGTASATASATLTHTHRNLTQVIDAPALHAYERLRRELGLALRECERGREPLLELLHPPSADEDEEDEEDRIPALGLDAESSDSDKDASHARSPPPFSLPPLSSVRTDTVLMQEKQHRQQQGDGEEDAEAHGNVLVVGLERLPPPGIEQVFEVDADADDDNRTHSRPRPKLSRAERIAAAKARRAAAAEVTASSLGLSVITLNHGEDTIGATAEKQPNRWGGPGGDVVQELKDVIWKVGEQRRLREERMQQQERQQQQLVPDAEAAVVGSVTSGDNTVVTREPLSPSPSPTVEDVNTSLPDPERVPPTNIT